MSHYAHEDCRESISPFLRALKHLERAILLRPDYASAHYGRVMACLQRQAKNALDVFARSADPTDAESGQFLQDAKAALSSAL